MPDSNEQKENLTEEEMAQSRITELEASLAQKEGELSRADARIAELEQMVAELEGKVATINESLAESEQKLAEAESALSLAVASYRAMVVQANPEVLEELVTGDTIESINESLSKAKTLVSKVKQGLEAEISSAKVPAGAPPRILPDLSALSPREKIQYAIGGKK